MVVGHRDSLGNGQPFVHRARVFGIDTGCYGGGSLTGLLLPAFRLLSTPSPRHYWAETRARFAPALARGADPLDLEWEQLEAMHARARSAGPERLAGHSERLAAA